MRIIYMISSLDMRLAELALICFELRNYAIYCSVIGLTPEPDGAPVLGWYP